MKLATAPTLGLLRLRVSTIVGVRVVFLSPRYPPEMRQFTRGLAEVGAEVYGVGDGAPEPDLRRYLAGYLEVPNLLDEDDVIARVHAWLRGRDIDRVLANWEPLVVVAARLRESIGLPGMSVDTVRGFRDKQLMKERVAAAGLRVPRSERVHSIADVWRAVEHTGFPAIIKPISGAGSADTYRVDSRADLERVLPAMRHVVEASVEEFIVGDEYTYDTVAIDGVPVYESVTRYLPNALEMRSNEWISPVMLTVRDLAQPHIQLGIAARARRDDGARHGRRHDAHGVVPHAERRGRVRRDRVSPRRRVRGRHDELDERRRSVHASGRAS